MICPICGHRMRDGQSIPDHPAARLRILKGWTMAELAQQAGVFKETVWRLEHGKRLYSDSLIKIALALGVHAEEIGGR